MDNKDVTSVPQPRLQRAFWRKVGLFVVCALVLSLCTTVAFVSMGSAPKAHAATFTEIWNDEFSGAANTPADSQWQYDLGTGYGCSGCPGNWGTGEVESDTNSTSNVFQDGSGHLVIKAIKNGSSWTSGRIETTNTSFAAPAGGELEVTASIQQPNVSGAAALGYWPAFWMLGSAFRGNYLNWPSVGEIDILEDVNGQSDVYSTLHCGTDPGGPCNETTGIGSGAKACSGCQTGYHTYTMILDRSVSPEQIRWYLDGNQIFSVSASQVPASTWSAAVDHSFFVILDLAMGGAFPNAICGCTSPSSSTASGFSMNVDYVRVYTANGSTTTPTPGTTPTPTPTSGGGNGYTYGVVNSGSTTAQPWFKPSGWTAGYVILHYVVPGQVQQNVYTTYNSSNGEWTYTVSGISSGQTLSYSFTYQQNGLQYDTSTFSWTHP